MAFEHTGFLLAQNSEHGSESFGNMEKARRSTVLIVRTIGSWGLYLRLLRPGAKQPASLRNNALLRAVPKGTGARRAENTSIGSEM